VSTFGAKSIVVTSANSGEGKTATVANLAVVLARAGKRVSVVSADLRRPRLHEFFSGEGKVGLSDVLAGRLPLPDALQRVTLSTSTAFDLPAVSLRLLASGRSPDDPAELLTSGSLAQILKALEEASDFVLIDVPPILPVTDALVVSAVARNVLLVVGPKGGTRSSVLAARQQLDKVGAQILGGVLNGLDTSMVQTYSY
jgi:capsular exopolysaccharide synthesis family protein